MIRLCGFMLRTHSRTCLTDITIILTRLLLAHLEGRRTLMGSTDRPAKAKAGSALSDLFCNHTVVCFILQY